MSAATDDLRLAVAWFESAFADGPAYGDPETMSWGNFALVFSGWRREGAKDGCCFVCARFRLEPDDRQVRRKFDRVLARSAIVLDIETNTKTGEIPPPLLVAASRVQALGLACVLYTSHSHQPNAPRYRIIVPLEREVATDVPAPLILAEQLGLLDVLDTSKVGAASVFYLPSCTDGALDQHETIVLSGKPIDTAWLEGVAAERQAEQDRVAAAAAQAAAERRAERISAGFNPDDSLIEKIRSRYDLADVLRSHAYDEAGSNYRHAASQSGCYGASIKQFGGIDRVYTHNAGDPLHHANLPSWCTVKAVDAFDAVVVLDFGGDRERALRELAKRFNLDKAPAKRAVAAVIYRKIRQGAPQAKTERAAFAAGEQHGLSKQETCDVARWVVGQLTAKEAA